MEEACQAKEEIGTCYDCSNHDDEEKGKGS